MELDTAAAADNDEFDDDDDDDDADDDAGIVHKGDGSNVHVARGAGHVMTPLLGDGASDAPVRRPASAVDGSLFVGDTRGVVRKLRPATSGGGGGQLTDIAHLKYVKTMENELN